MRVRGKVGVRVRARVRIGVRVRVTSRRVALRRAAVRHRVPLEAVNNARKARLGFGLA
jgi:hypothetical protein